MLGPKVAAAKAVAHARARGRPRRRDVAARQGAHAAGAARDRPAGASGCAHGSAVISATNGKTTTAAMAAAILERDGAPLVHNRAGANMAGGVASALAAASRRGGRELTGELGLFEVDEFWLGPVVEELEPRALLLGNLFRDQLDRYGELEIIADRWAEVVAAHAGPTALVLNADDPLVADLGRDRDARLLRRRRRLARVRRAAARGGLQALPALRPPVRLRGDLPRPPRPLRVPELRRAPARRPR